MEYSSSSKVNASPKKREEEINEEMLSSLASSVGNMDLLHILGAEGADPGGNNGGERVSGLDASLRQRFESTFGYDLSNVRVHYNSDLPEEIGAHAYTQGSDIYLARGMERHLAHETGHVIQQMKGEVQSNSSVAGSGYNDSTALESQASLLSSMALSGAAVGSLAEGYGGGVPEGGLQSVELAAGPIQMKKKRAGAGYKTLFRSPGWKQASARFEKKLAAYAYNHPFAKEAANDGLTKLKNILLKYYRDKAKDERQEYERIMRAAFTADSKTSAGQIGSDVSMDDIEQIVGDGGNGNLREKMTAFFNAAYNNGGMNTESTKKSVTLKNVMREAVGERKSKKAIEAGVDKTGIREQDSRFHGAKRGFVGFFKHGFKKNEDLDLYDFTNIAIQGNNGQMFDALNSNSSRNRHSKEEIEQGGKTAGEYSDMGAGLSEREKRFAAKNLGKGEGESVGDDEKLPWREGNAYLDVKEGSKLDKKAGQGQGMYLTAGISATTARMLNSYKWVGGSDPLKFRLALMGWMMTSEDHSLYEIMKGSHLVGVKGQEDLTDAVSMYESIDPLSEDEVRQNAGDEGRLPHEVVYEETREVKTFAKDDGSRETKIGASAMASKGATGQADYSETLAKKLAPHKKQAAEKYWDTVLGTSMDDPDYEGKVQAAESDFNNLPSYFNTKKEADGSAGYDERYYKKEEAIPRAERMALGIYSTGAYTLMNKVRGGSSPAGLIEKILRLNGSLAIIDGLYGAAKKKTTRNPRLFYDAEEKRSKPLYARVNKDFKAEQVPERLGYQYGGTVFDALITPLIAQINAMGENDPKLTIDFVDSLVVQATAELNDKIKAGWASEIAEEVSADVEMAEEGLEKLPGESCMVYRGDWQLMNKRTGSTEKFSKFVSTAKKMDKAEYFARNYEGKKFQTPILYRIQLVAGGRGRDLERYSVLKDGEAEVLCMPGFKFKINRRYDKGEQGNFSTNKKYVAYDCVEIP